MSPRDENKLMEWLNALIVLAQWDKSLPLYIARLLHKPEQYQKALELIREPSQNDGPPAPPGDVLYEGEWQKLYKFTTRAGSLRKLFAAGRDPFLGATKDEISLLASISDLTTDAQTMFYSQNGTFQLILETVRQRPELDTASLLTDGLNKFYTLLDTNELVAEQLYELACTDDWHVVLASLYDYRDYTTDYNPTAKKSLEQWNKNLTMELRSVLLKPAKLYRVPQKLIKLAWERRSLFTVALNSVPPDKRLNGFELRQQVSNVAYPLFVKEAKVETEEIESELQMLAVVALHYVSMRKFVKLDGLVSGWPYIASLAMTNFKNLEYVEDFFVEKKQRPTVEELEKRDARELYERCANDPIMIRFLQFRPYFREINEDELRRYRPLAPVTISVSEPSPPPPIIAPPAEDVGVAKAFTPTAVTSARVCELVIKITESLGEFELVAGGEYEITLLVSGTEVAKGKTKFSIRKLLDRMLNTIGVISEESLQSVMNGLFSGNNAEQVLVRGGAQLLNSLITQTGLTEKLADAFRGEDPVRLVITPDVEALHFLPWEWLPRPGYPELLLSNVRFSLVRSSPLRREMPLLPLSSPVRILSLFPNSPVGTRDISESSINALEILNNEGAQYKPLVRDQATLIRLTDELEKFRPHIVHFEGYINVASDTDPNVTVLLSSLESSTEAVHLSRFASLLEANGVQLFVAGRNDSSRTLKNPAAVISNVLATSAVPAVLAPIRAVDDATATSLITEFYRAFIGGNNLEQALYTARRKVASRGGDWTSFALFANPSILDFFQPLPPTA